jgi:hypothetical protein
MTQMLKALIATPLVVGFFSLCIKGPGLQPSTIQQSGAVPAKPQVTAKPKWGKPSEPPQTPKKLPTRPRYNPEPDPMEKFHQDLDEAVLREVDPRVPEFRSALAKSKEINNTLPHRRIIFHLLETAKKTPAENTPAILLAADLLAAHLWCSHNFDRNEPEANCKRLRNGLARCGLALEYGGALDPVYSYRRDLLWRVWRDYPTTDWGERVFVLLLESGWDTSGDCANGIDDFREVIRRGEEFLRTRPSSAYREPVTFLVAEAYVTWWALANETGGTGMSDYVDPKEYQQGSEEARLHAIRLFEQLRDSVTRTEFAEYGSRVVPHLQQKRVPQK